MGPKRQPPQEAMASTLTSHKKAYPPASSPTLVSIHVLDDGTHPQGKQLSSIVSVSQNSLSSTVSQDSASDGTTRRGIRSPGFWDTLSKIRLSVGALRQFDRRVAQPKPLLPLAATDLLDFPTRRASETLKRFSRHGGPDLTHVRGLSSSVTEKSEMLSPSPPVGPKEKGKSSPYDGDFEQKLIDLNIYPNNKASKPQNLRNLQEYLARRRHSLSSSKSNENRFQEFIEACDRAADEPETMTHVVPIVTGKHQAKYWSALNKAFSNLEPFDEYLTDAKPDLYDGTAAEQIDQHVREHLNKQIIPSTNTTRPAVPNLFLEAKGNTGRIDVAKRQACYDGAFGARAMLSLQNYGAEEMEYDGNAYTFSVTFFYGLLKIYATHPTQPRSPGGRPGYHMTCINSYEMTHSSEGFREGAAAYRNIRELAKTYRDKFINHANQMSRQMTAKTRSSVARANCPSMPTGAKGFSDISEHGLVQDPVMTQRSKRPRQPGSDVDDSSRKRHRVDGGPSQRTRAHTEFEGSASNLDQFMDLCQ